MSKENDKNLTPDIERILKSIIKNNKDFSTYTIVGGNKIGISIPPTKVRPDDKKKDK